MAEYNRFATPMARGAEWPDGSPVSNWSQAIAMLARYGSVTGVPRGADALDHDDAERLEVDGVPVYVRA